MSDKFATLKVLMGDITGKMEFNIDQSINIGRDAEGNEVIIPNMNVSRFHAKIEKGDKGYFLEDLGSHNGTLLNGRLARKEWLSEGDIINIADTEIQFFSSIEKANENDLKLSNQEVGNVASDATSFIDLSELKQHEMEELRKNKPSITDPWEEI